MRPFHTRLMSYHEFYLFLPKSFQGKAYHFCGRALPYSGMSYHLTGYQWYVFPYKANALLGFLFVYSSFWSIVITIMGNIVINLISPIYVCKWDNYLFNMATSVGIYRNGWKSNGAMFHEGFPCPYHNCWKDMVSLTSK